MHWIPCLLLANLLAATALTPEQAIELAERELSDFPDAIELCSRRNRYKKITLGSLHMSKRNALIKKALDKLESTEDHLVSKVRDLLSEKFSETISCSGAVTCSADSKYRTIDGKCNNRANPTWGAAGSPFVRLLPAIYENDDFSPKTKGTFRASKQSCKKAGDLPNPRLVSSSFHPDNDVPSSVATLFLVEMGQFLDHDLTFTPSSPVSGCCQDGSQDGCSTISIPSNDPFFSNFSQTCLEFTRSVHYCDSSPREQFNDITSFIDASNVYGSVQSVHDSVRDSNGYLLNVTITKTGKQLLPKDKNGQYFAGDIRALDMPALTSMHTLFVREHNRIAKDILAAFPNLEKETIFQETRRIIGAEMQNIVYGQFLPVVLGIKAMERYNLKVTNESNYDPNANADIANAFASAAYRFGHTMLQGEIQRLALTPSGSNSSYLLKDAFFVSTNYEDKDGAGMEELILGIMSHASQTLDRLFVDDVTNHLFNFGASFGTDLVSLNIARGRDHGLPTYGYWRRHCGLPELCNWEKEPKNISKKNWNILKNLYSSPNDIDLFTAGLAEKPNEGSVMGETFRCIIGNQFRNTKFGDRYFFTHKGQTGSFTTNQIKNIRTRSLGQLLCDNTDIKRVRVNVFDLHSNWIDCPNTSTLDLALFNIGAP